MNATTLPVICGAALTAMSAAGLSHWWSVRQFSTAYSAGVIVTPPPAPVRDSAPDSAPAPDKAPRFLAAEPAKSAPSPNAPPKEFYESLITRMENLQTQNRDLLDQLAETNRDLMKLEFRVDTHSESFRPLPVSEDRPFTRLENDPGVLPPRAEPVLLPTYE